MKDLEQRARAVVVQSLQPGRSAELGLKELADHRRSEVARLARRCLGYLGNFDPVVAALNDPDQKAYWSDPPGGPPSSGYVEQLREAIARGPETAAAVREAMEKHFGPEDGAALDRMLWGYTNKDLKNGANVKLVQSLEHEKIAFRVLGIWNLKDITGKKMYYQPEQTSAQRRRSITEWKRYREAGNIRIGSAGERPHPGKESPPPLPSATPPAPQPPPPPPPPPPAIQP